MVVAKPGSEIVAASDYVADALPKGPRLLSLGNPIWQGVSALLGGLSLIATVAVFVLTQNASTEDRKRDLDSRSGEVTVDTVYGPIGGASVARSSIGATGKDSAVPPSRWAMIVSIGNKGPGTLDSIQIDYRATAKLVAAENTPSYYADFIGFLPGAGSRFDDLMFFSNARVADISFSASDQDARGAISDFAPGQRISMMFTFNLERNVANKLIAYLRLHPQPEIKEFSVPLREVGAIGKSISRGPVEINPFFTTFGKVATSGQGLRTVTPRFYALQTLEYG